MTTPQTTYKIIRFRFMNGHRTIKGGLTLEEAQEHCSSPKTEGDGWFDGFRQETEQEQRRRARRRR